jgi:hypothetical protein
MHTVADPCQVVRWQQELKYFYSHLTFTIRCKMLFYSHSLQFWTLLQFPIRLRMVCWRRKQNCCWDAVHSHNSQIRLLLLSTYVPKNMAQLVVRLQHLWRYVVSCIANLTEENDTVFIRITKLATLVVITWLKFKPSELVTMAKLQGRYVMMTQTPRHFVSGQRP